MNTAPETHRRRNIRTGLVLALIALVFFAGVIAKFLLFA